MEPVIRVLHTYVFLTERAGRVPDGSKEICRLGADHPRTNENRNCRFRRALSPAAAAVL